eukprot:CFRG2775T1
MAQASAQESQDSILLDAAGVPFASVNLVGKLLDGVFNLWSLLNMAIEMDFAGHDSQSKAVEMYDEVMDVISRKGKNVDVNDMEDLLDEYIQIDFNCTAEDGSQRIIAELIYQVVCKVEANDFEWVKSVLVENEGKLKNRTESGKRVEYFIDQASTALKAEAAAQAAAEEMAIKIEEIHLETPPEEDDGWTTVAPKKRK